jgi:hypothetical protein
MAPILRADIHLHPEAACLLIDIDRRAVIQHSAARAAGSGWKTATRRLITSNDDLGLPEIVCTEKGAYRIQSYCLRGGKGRAVRLEYPY